MSSAIGRDLKARNGNFNFDVQVWVKFFSSLLGPYAAARHSKTTGLIWPSVERWNVVSTLLRLL